MKMESRAWRLAKHMSPFVKAGLLLALWITPFAQPVCQGVEPRKPSHTAERNAAMRAIGAMAPDENIRSSDNMAFKFVSKEFWERTPYSPDYGKSMEFIRKYRIGSYYYINARTKHMDALLRQALRRGVKQVVLLGAGYDSRAYRFKDFPKDVRFIEVDLPDTQKLKKARVKKILGSLPAQVMYVPIDFNTQTLEKVLLKAGYDPSKRAFFIWEGVTMYLDPSGVDGTLDFIANHSAPGSSVVFDYVLKSVIDGTFNDFSCKRAVVKVAEWGAPWVYGIKADQAGGFLNKRGLVLLSDLGPDELEVLYLVDGDGGVEWPTFRCARILHAAVPVKKGQEEDGGAAKPK